MVPLLFAAAAHAQQLVTALEPELKHWSGDFDAMFERRMGPAKLSPTKP